MTASNPDSSNFYSCCDNRSVSSPTASYVLASVASLRDMSTHKVQSYEIAQTLGYYSPGDGGGNMFYWNPTSVVVDDGGNTVKAASASTGRWAALDVSRTNVKQYGAKGDGVTDDTARITAAMQAYASPFVPAGTYIIATTGGSMLPPSGVTLWAIPGSATLKLGNGGTGFIACLGVSFVNFRGLTFDGNISNTPYTTRNILAFGGSNIIFDGCRFQNFKSRCLEFSTVTYCGVRNCTFNNIGTNYLLDGLDATPYTCITLDDVVGNHDFFVTGCTFSNTGSDAMDLSGTNITVLGNTFNNIGAPFALNGVAGFSGIYALNCTNLSVTGNVVTSATGNGIDMVQNTAMTVSGNSVTGSGQSGIGIFNCVGGTISGNTTKNNVQVSVNPFKGGITLRGGTNLSITGNISTDDQGSKTQNYGLYLYDGSMSNVWIDVSNNLQGNLTADFGGASTVPTYSDPFRGQLQAGIPAKSTTASALSFGIDTSASTSLALNNNASTYIMGGANNFGGMVIISDLASNLCGLFLFGFGGSVNFIGQSYAAMGVGGFSTTLATANKTNIQWDGTGIKLENKTGVNTSYKIFSIRNTAGI